LLLCPAWAGGSAGQDGVPVVGGGAIPVTGVGVGGVVVVHGRLLSFGNFISETSFSLYILPD